MAKYVSRPEIEHTWGILKRKVEKHHVSNIQQLCDVIMEEWKRMPATTCAALVNKVSTYMGEVLNIYGIFFSIYTNFQLKKKTRSDRKCRLHVIDTGAYHTLVKTMICQFQLVPPTIMFTM